MNKRQEAQWLYGKGFELAVLLKGKPDNLETILETSELVNGILLKNYDELATKIALLIGRHSTKLIRRNLAQANRP